MVFGLRKSDLIKLNNELFEKTEKYKTLYEELKKENAELLEENKSLKLENENLIAKQNATPPLIELEKKVKSQAKLSEEAKFGASVIGKIVIKAASCCNKLTSSNDGYDPKELVNLILGRTEVAKAEILKIVESEIPLETKREQICACQKSTEDYFSSVMAQKD